MSDSVRQTAKTPQVVLGDEEIFEAHVGGKLSVELKGPLDTQRALSIAYTPGVAQVSPRRRRHRRYRATSHRGARRSDFPNQINNVPAFPGAFRGALDAGARRITEKMKVAAAEAIFSVASDDLAPDRIVPSPLDPRVGRAVASAVAAAAAKI